VKKLFSIAVVLLIFSLTAACAGKAGSPANTGPTVTPLPPRCRTTGCGGKTTTSVPGNNGTSRPGTVYSPPVPYNPNNFNFGPYLDTWQTDIPTPVPTEEPDTIIGVIAMIWEVDIWVPLQNVMNGAGQPSSGPAVSSGGSPVVAPPSVPSINWDGTYTISGATDMVPGPDGNGGSDCTEGAFFSQLNGTTVQVTNNTIDGNPIGPDGKVTSTTNSTDGSGDVTIANYSFTQDASGNAHFSLDLTIEVGKNYTCGGGSICLNPATGTCHASWTGTRNP
jgi:hypothetical protein